MSIEIREPPDDPVEISRVRATVASRLFDEAVAPRIGRYALVSKLGEGGMGIVFAGLDDVLDRRVALKLLHADLDTEAVRVRLLREAQALARLSHPNVVQVYEVGEHEGRVFLAMELVRGADLRRWVSGTARTWKDIVDIYAQVGSGLAAAHDVGVIHRDFKAENAVVGDDGRARVLDFGLARWHQADEMATTQHGVARSEPSNMGPSGDFQLTRTGSVLGTPAYMAPEQFEGLPADARTDQFSFCVSLWEALFGCRPFASDARAWLTSPRDWQNLRASSRARFVPRAVEAALRRGLAPDPNERWPSMHALLAVLQRRTRSRRRVLWATSLLATTGASAAVGGMLASSTTDCIDAMDRIAPFWNDRQRQDLRASFDATSSPIAASTWDLVERAIETYVSDWVAAHRDACERHVVRREESATRFDARMRCLEGRRRSLRAFLEVLAEPDSALIERAVKTAHGLPSLASCADVRWLEAETPPPDDPEAAALVERELDELALATALESAARYDAALELARSSLERAEALEYGPLVARARAVVGSVLTWGSDVESAERYLRDAYHEARRAGVRDVAATTSNALAHTLSVRTSRRAEAMDWALLASTEAALTEDPMHRSAALNTLGVAAIHVEDYERAESAFRAALDLRLAAVGPDDPSVAMLRANLGQFAYLAGEYDEALELFEQAVRDQERGLGSEHPALADSLGKLANLLFQLDRPLEANPHLERAVAISLASRGEEHPESVKLSVALGGRLRRRGELREAERLLERTLRLVEEGVGFDVLKTTTPLEELAEVYLDKADPEGAVQLLRRAVEVGARTVGPNHRDVAIARANLSRALVAAGSPHEALGEIDFALQTLSDGAGPESFDVSLALLLRSEVLLALSRPDDAEADLRRCLTIREQLFGSNALQASDALAALVEVQMVQGRLAEAIDTADRTLTLAETASWVRDDELARVRFLRARAAWALHRDALAPEQARAALSSLRLAGLPAAEEDIREIESWLGSL